jgi:tRNA (guanine37-N1)-methyltransferase
LPKLGKKFDRIIMPLPKGAADFLDVAVGFLKPGGTIHFYQFLQETDFFKPAEELVKNAAERAGRHATILYSGKCGKVAPGRFRIVVDAKIE